VGLHFLRADAEIASADAGARDQARELVDANMASAEKAA